MSVEENQRLYVYVSETQRAGASADPLVHRVEVISADCGSEEEINMLRRNTGVANASIVELLAMTRGRLFGWYTEGGLSAAWDALDYLIYINPYRYPVSCSHAEQVRDEMTCDRGENLVTNDEIIEFRRKIERITGVQSMAPLTEKSV